MVRAGSGPSATIAHADQAVAKTDAARAYANALDLLRFALLLAGPILLAIMLAMIATPVRAQTPFPCTGDLYQVQSGQLRIFNTQTSTYTDVGPDNDDYNSLGYNPVDGYFYGTQDNNIIRIDATGQITMMFAIGFNTFVGDIGDNNLMYLRRNAGTLMIVDLVTQQQTLVSLSRNLTGGAADWAFVDTPAGRRLIAPGNQNLSLIDPDTGQNDVVSIANYPNEGGSGATWSDANGRVFTFRNTTGNVYEILDYLTPNPSAVLVAVGDPSNSNDGTNCRLQPFPNFPPLAFDDAFTTRFQTPLTGENMILGDGTSAVDNDPDGTPITVNPVLVSDPSNGTVQFQVDGSFDYTPNNDFSGEDQFTYEIIDASGLTAQAVVTITVTRPRLTVEKQSELHSASTFMTPGSDVIYNIVVSNSGDQEVDPDTILIVDTWPTDLEFHFGDLDAGGGSQFQGSDAVAWEDNASGLDFDFDRDVAFSNQVSPPTSFGQCTYQPTNGYDPDVRYICITPKGALLPSGAAQFSIRGRIN